MCMWDWDRWSGGMDGAMISLLVEMVGSEPFVIPPLTKVAVAQSPAVVDSGLF